jgi:hypothetical protein
LRRVVEQHFQLRLGLLLFEANAVLMLILQPTPSDTSGFEKLAKAADNLH